VTYGGAVFEELVERIDQQLQTFTKGNTKLFNRQSMIGLGAITV
jgi:hypothetical protein